MRTPRHLPKRNNAVRELREYLENSRDKMLRAFWHKRNRGRRLREAIETQYD